MRTIAKCFTFKAAADGKPAEILIYGEISDTLWWGDEVTPKGFKKELDALGDVDEINVFVNSYGGDVFAGHAIYSMLKRHKAKIHVFVDGVAASIASVIAMAGDTITMPKNSMMMIHNPWTWGAGDSAYFLKLADDLDRIRESIITTYESRGIKRDEIIAIMDAETWLTAEEAVEKGFADEIEESQEVAACVKDGKLYVNEQEMDFSRYRHPPKMLVAQAAQTEPNKPAEVTQTDNSGLFALYQAAIQANENKKRLGGVTNDLK